MEEMGKCSSCRGVSFEDKFIGGKVWSKRFFSFDRRSFDKIIAPNGVSATFQRSESRPSGHFCDLDNNEEEDNVENPAVLEELNFLSQVEQSKMPSNNPAAATKPESRLSVILLDQGPCTVYKRLFLVCFVLNLTALMLAASGCFPYAEKEGALFSVGNILALVLCRNEAFLRCLFWVAVKALGRSWVPLPLKTAATSFLQCLGGIHSGCGISSIIWLIYSLTHTLCHRETTSDEIIVVAATILILLVISSVAAFPPIRHLYHDAFEEFHRFAGWGALALLWVFVILTATYNPAHNSYNLSATAFAKKQEFWFTAFINFLVILPWLTVRKVAVQVSAPSGHASLIKFQGKVKAGLLGRISRSALSDWHAFGIISDCRKDEHMMLAGAVGDFTRGPVSEPPKYLYTRCIHFPGLPYLINMYNKVVLVATGSGICVFLSFMLQPCPAEVYVIWVAKAVEKTFPEEIIKWIRSYPSEKMIVHDTAALGRPNVAEMTVKAVRNWEAEVVIVTSNPSGSRDVVNGCRAAGIPAFGPIWDS